MSTNEGLVPNMIAQQQLPPCSDVGLKPVLLSPSGRP